MIRRVLLMATVVFATMAMSGLAVAAPPAMTLSSWETTSVDGVITGGTRTVTVTNTLDEPIVDLSVPLDPTPCECDIVSAATDAGTIDGFSWNVGTLQPGETKTLTLGYELAAPSTVTAWIPDLTATALLLVMVLALLAAGLAVRRQDRLTGWTFSG